MPNYYLVSGKLKPVVIESTKIEYDENDQEILTFIEDFNDFDK